jgi:alcohol dehydrogenase class IV
MMYVFFCLLKLVDKYKHSANRCYVRSTKGLIMLSSFNLKFPAQIIFGQGKLAQLENIISRFGSRLLLVLGNRSFSETIHYDSLQKIFLKLGIQIRTVHIESEPSPEMIDTIVADLFSKEIDLIVAIGGGSTIDGGKAISVMLAEGGHVSRFLEGVGDQIPSGSKIPFIAVPTTSGTGSEATSNAVISSVGSQGFKSSLRHDNFIPNLALIDPTLTLSCPREITVTCGMDCFTQLVEGYLSTNSSPLTDVLALEGIRAIHRSLRLVCAEGSNLLARTDLSYATLLSGIILTNSGLGTVHGFASAVGGLLSIPHGVICGTLMAPVNGLTLKNLRVNANDHPALIKYTELGKIFSDQPNKADTWYQDFFIEELYRLSDDLNIEKLGKYGAATTDIKNIVGKTSNKFNPAQLTKEDLATILCSKI